MNTSGVPKILMTSLSSKIALYDSVLRQAKMFNPNASVIAVDSNPNCPGADYVKYFRILPRLDILSAEELLNILGKWRITHVIPTRDDELQYWAQIAPLLLKNQVAVLLSSCDAINVCKDKLSFPEKITISGLKHIPSLLSPNLSNYPQWVIKERYGSGSRRVGTNLSKNDAVNLALSLEEPIFQPYIEGEEFTAEAWVDKDGQVPAVILRWREKIVNGESHVSTTFQNLDWEKKIAKLFSSIEGLRGHCLAQCIVDNKGIPNLIEINPRLGGASPLSLNVGLNSILWSLQEEMDSTHDLAYNPIYGAKLSKMGNLTFISK
jgi:carbamoyl-phosphate synthase large subunit